MNVYLIGYMGSGKTTVGRKLATRLNRSFIDLDAALEKHSGMSVAAWFESKGEEHFRKAEAELLTEFSAQKDLVIATGGGTPCFSNNLELMKNTGVVVYLDLDVDQLVSRLQTGQAQRPLIAGKSPEELTEFITQHLESRKPYYEQAHVLVSAMDLNAERLDELAEFVQALL
jgi:shikimate kinase